MVISGISYGQCYFSGDFPDVVLRLCQGACSVSIKWIHDVIYVDPITEAETVTSENTEILSESYTPDSLRKITLKDLGRVLEAYNDTDTLDFNGKILKALRFTLSATDSVSGDSEDISFYVFASRVISGYLPSQCGWLTRYGQKKTSSARREILGCVQNYTAATVTLHYLDGTTEKTVTVSLFSCTVDKTLILVSDVSLDTIVALAIAAGTTVVESQILYYDISLTGGNNTSDTVRYINDTRNWLHSLNVVYLNSFGIAETISLTGSEEIAPNLDGNLVTADGFYIQMDPVLYDVGTVNTGYIGKKAYGALLDMLHSPLIYIYDGIIVGDRITITDVDFTHKLPTNSGTNVKFTYRTSRDRNLKYDRAATGHNTGIFDHTFDNSFE